MQQTPSAMRLLHNRFGEAVLYEVNRAAFDQAGSAAVFQRHFGEIFRQEDTLFLVIGTDSGLLPRWIASQGVARGSRYLFIEPEALLEPIGATLADIIDKKRLVLSGPDQWEDLQTSLDFSDYAYLGNLRVVPSIGASDAFLSDYRALAKAVSDHTVAYMREVGQHLGHFTFLQCQIENLADNLLPAQCLEGAFVGREAVLLAGGPSLDDLLPWVRQHRRQVVVLAVSRIARQLQDAGITPDIVFTIDPHAVSFDVSKEGLRFPPETLLVCGNHAHPALQAQWPGPVLYCGRRFPWASDVEAENLPMAGPTVTNLALETAIAMGFSRIVLGGVDLCYDRQGHTHASGSNERQAGPCLGDVSNRVETNGGWMADTDPPFAQAVAQLGIQATRAHEAGCKLLSAAPGAAKIAGVGFVPLDALVPASGETAAQAKLRERMAPFTPAWQTESLNATLKELAHTRRQLREIERSCEQALECNRRLFSLPGEGHDMRFKKRMDKIEHRLDTRYAELSRLVKRFGIAGFLRLGRPMDDGEWSEREIQQWGDDYYRIYAESSRALLKLIDRARERVELRLQELTPQPDLALLVQGWADDQTPARARRLLQQRPELAGSIGPAWRQRFDALEQQFLDRLAEQDTAHTKKVRARHSLGKVRARLQQLFEQQAADELGDVARALAVLDGDTAQELHSLAEGYRAELLGMNERALANYQRVIDSAAISLEQAEPGTQNPRLEDALRRMSSLCLQQGDGETALTALQILASLSPAYLPQYAELLRLQGRIQDAADHYTQYLKQVPGDLATIIRLGKLYHEAGAHDSARWAYEHVLAQTPDDRAALELLASLPTVESCQ